MDSEKLSICNTSSTIGQTLYYGLQRWDKLNLCTTDDYLKIDNNLVENAIRPMAIGRKNYLFAGSHNGALWVAMFYSFPGTCKINHVYSFEWLMDVLIRIQEYPIKNLHQLRPHGM